MAFVTVPKDLSKVKTKVALNLTKRQLICFSAAAVIGIPTYLFSRGTVGNTAAALLMIGLMLPMFFLAMYEKDGQPAELAIRNYIRVKFLWPGKRPYKTENLYEILGAGRSRCELLAHATRQEAKSIAPHNKTTAKASVGKRKAGKKQ